jgi:hypothetical protein
MYWLRAILVTTLSASALGACRDKTPASASPNPTSIAQSPAPSAAAVISAADGSYDVQIPPRWTGSYRVDSLSSAERGTARPGAINIVYLPRDTTVLPQTLLVVAAYDSAAWVRARSNGGPPPGDSIMAHSGRVYVLGMPQSNPFAPGSPDALKFDSLALNPVEKSALVHPKN